MKTTKQRIVTILVSATVIVCMAFLLNFLMEGSSAEDFSTRSLTPLAETLPTNSEPEHVSQKVLFDNKTAEYDGLTMEVLSMTASGNDAVVAVRWELEDSRDWKINNAILKIDSQDYSLVGFDLVEGVFHYADGTACKIDMQNDTIKDDCSETWLQEESYRIDRLIFANVPGDFLNRSVELRILGMTAYPNEGEYCKVLNINNIQDAMQEDFPGVELECFQDEGLLGYGIRQDSAYANDNKALAELSNYATKALLGSKAGMWKFDLTAD